MYTYKTRGVCSRSITIEMDGDIIKHVEFEGGCRGNTQGVARLAEGRNIDEVISLCKGILCRPTTSCPDQLACELEEIKASRA